MKRRVVLVKKALLDFNRLIEFQAARSLSPALDAADSIRTAINSLTEHAHRGRQLDDQAELRTLLVASGKDGYVIQYRVEHSQVVVARIFHGRERRES